MKMIEYYFEFFSPNLWAALGIIAVWLIFKWLNKVKEVDIKIKRKL
jgi:predicted PurR-regulated permease PerM